MAFPPLVPRAVGRRTRLRAALTPGRVNLLVVFGLMLFQVAVSVSAPYWARLLRRPIPVSAGADEDSGLATPSPTPAASSEAERRINVQLLFPAEDRSGLVMEERAVAYHPDLGRQLRIVLVELMRGSNKGLAAAFDPATRVLEVFVSSQGCAYVDLSREAGKPVGTGSQMELLSVYALVDTLAVNFPAVRRVQVLLEDHPVDNLAGHADLTRPLLPDMTLLAPAALVTPSETAAAVAPSATPVGERR